MLCRLNLLAQAQNSPVADQISSNYPMLRRLAFLAVFTAVILAQQTSDLLDKARKAFAGARYQEAQTALGSC
jgi:hypothetical protein